MQSAAIKRFGDHDIEFPFQRPARQRLKSKTQKRRP
jgi:hypothetical protein